ncbi:MAG: hypothetical protein GX054_10915 [Clostridiales bacterium]|jgi:hypothetical protein|nr:hypothetical protein [Clostridiales bacterium]
MKIKFSKAIKIFIFLLLILSIIFPGYVDSPSIAQGEVTSTEQLVGDRVVIIDGRDYVAPQSDFMINYTINNGSDVNISQVIIKETLLGEEVAVGGKRIIPELEYPIAPGESRHFKGEKFKSKKDVSSYTLEYTIEYIEEGGSHAVPLKSGKREISILSTDIDVTYSTSTKGPIPVGEEVTYTAELQSAATVPIENILVQDSVLGELGVVPVLEPGTKAVVSQTFKLDKTTKSHPILSFDDPMGINDKITRTVESATVEVEVEEKPVEKPLVISGRVNKSKVAPNEPVDFSLSVENKGNRALNNVKLVDWSGKEVLFKDILAPGKEATVIYTARVEPGVDYTFKATAVEEGTGRNVQDTYSVNFSGIAAELQITNRVTAEDIAVGDVVTIEYSLKNTGETTMVDIVVEEPEFGEVARFSELQPGQEETFSTEQIIEQDTSSHPRVYAKDKVTGNAYEFHGDFIEILINAIESHPLLTLRLTSEPETLSEPGTVDLVCTVINEGDIKIDNIELILNERTLYIGSILTLEPGDQETLTLPGLSIEEDTSFTVTAKGITYDGQEVEFTSEPYEIKIGEDIPEEEKAENPKLSFLKKLLGVIIALAIATAGGMVYLIRDLRKGGKKEPKGTKRVKTRRKNTANRKGQQ